MLTSFSQPEVDEFAQDVRDRLIVAIPEEWVELRHLNEEDPRALELRRVWDRNRWRAGFGAITWPAEHGGSGLSPVEQVLFHEVWGELQAPQELNVIGYGLAGRAIIDWGTEEQRRRFLPRILSGEDIWCEGFSEPNAGSDMAAYVTAAKRSGAGWRIKGQKTWTSFSAIANRMYCLAKTSDAPRHHNLSVFLLDMHAPGVEVQPIRQLTGQFGFSQVFIDAEVGDEDLLGEEGDGWKLSTIGGAHRQRERAASGAQQCARLGRVARQLRECLSESGANGAMADRVNKLATRVDGYKWQIRRSVEAAVRGRDQMPSQSVMKIYSSELMLEITSCGLELGCEAHEAFWRDRHLDSRKYSIAGGPNEIYRDLIANRVLGLGR